MRPTEISSKKLFTVTAMKIKRNVSPEELVNMMRDWLKIYLPNIRFRSQNTIDSYESSLNLYLDFLEKNKQITEKTLVKSVSVNNG